MFFKVEFVLPAQLAHVADHLVDVLLTVSVVTTLNKVDNLLAETTKRRGELEGPEELVDSLEVRADSVELVDHVLDADDVVLAESLLDNGVVRQGDALSINTAVSTLVNKLADGLQVGVSPCDVGVNLVEHLESGLVQLHKDTVVNLEESEKLQDLAGLGVHTVDTADTDHKGNLSLRGHVNVARGLGLAGEANSRALLLSVLSEVLLSTLEDLLTDFLALGLHLLEAGGASGLDLYSTKH